MASQRFGSDLRGERSQVARVRRTLGTIVLVAVCAVVVTGIALTNSGSPSPSAASSNAATVGITLYHPSRYGAVNRHFAALHVRVRVVRLSRGCKLQVPAHPQHLFVRKDGDPHFFAVDEAPRGNTTVVVLSRRGLAASFEVLGSAPPCLPITGTAPFSQLERASL
jgi:hypothetical protein